MRILGIPLTLIIIVLVAYAVGARFPSALPRPIGA